MTLRHQKKLIRPAIVVALSLFTFSIWFYSVKLREEDYFRYVSAVFRSFRQANGYWPTTLDVVAKDIATRKPGLFSDRMHNMHLQSRPRLHVVVKSNDRAVMSIAFSWCLGGKYHQTLVHEP